MRTLVQCGVAALALLAAAVSYATAADKRIVSIGGDITEIIHALGAASDIVAVDTTSLYPPEMLARPKVGYMRSLSAEGVLTLHPDLVIASEKSGPPSAVAQIRASGVPFLLLTGEVGIDGFAKRVGAIADALDQPGEGAALIARTRGALDAIAQEVSRQPGRPKALFLLTSSGRGTPVASGTGTTVAELIALAGAQNAVTAYEQYKPLTPEAAVTAAPDYLVVTRQTLEAAGGRDAVLAMPQVALTPAARAGRLVAIDGGLLIGFGPRTPQAVVTLFRAFHPAATLSPALTRLADRR